MVTESIFHNFVVNDAEGAERIAEVTNIRVAEVKAIRESENQKRTC